ncbi:hypothetical protein GDO81_022129 [Engystomops pustulosus]|uniref:Uncharacterized protein n=1 Tax=Engystomops pustulosus TaxID=76066 RepID=A0AAV6YRP3_ENGPU|nr:hypothetical protein GDO81_022129 [Engystomops pustulosus]
MSALTLRLLQTNPGLLSHTFYLPVGQIAVLPHDTSHFLTPFRTVFHYVNTFITNGAWSLKTMHHFTGKKSVCQNVCTRILAQFSGIN